MTPEQLALIPEMIEQIKRIAARRELPDGEPCKGYSVNLVTQVWARDWVEKLDAVKVSK